MWHEFALFVSFRWLDLNGIIWKCGFSFAAVHTLPQKPHNFLFSISNNKKKRFCSLHWNQTVSVWLWHYGEQRRNSEKETHKTQTDRFITWHDRCFGFRISRFLPTIWQMKSSQRIEMKYIGTNWRKKRKKNIPLNQFSGFHASA